MPIRGNLTSAQEIREILIADLVLIVAFTLTLSGGYLGYLKDPSQFITNIEYYVPIVALAVTLSFILHELMHKFVAQRYGALAEFRTSAQGLMITFVTGLLGFLLGIPGATMIYVQSFTPEENGIVSLAGPLTNFVIFLVFLSLYITLAPPPGSYLYSAISFTIFISLLLAFFNMLPIFPLDGSKVLAWSKPIYFISMGVLLVLMLVFSILSVTEIIFLIFFAIILSFFYRTLL